MDMNTEIKMEKYEATMVRRMDTNYLNNVAKKFGERTASDEYFFKRDILLRLRKEKRGN